MKVTKSQLMQIIKEEFSRYASKQHKNYGLARKRLVGMVHELMGVAMDEAEEIVRDLEGLKARQQKYVPQSPPEEPAVPDADYGDSFTKRKIPPGGLSGEDQL